MFSNIISAKVNYDFMEIARVIDVNVDGELYAKILIVMYDDDSYEYWLRDMHSGEIEYLFGGGGAISKKHIKRLLKKSNCEELAMEIVEKRLNKEKKFLAID